MALAAFALGACSQLSLGTCASTADCKSGATCDTTQAPPVCVILAGACFPSCASGQMCNGGICMSPGCSPACTATQVCDLDAGTCQTVTTPVITVTSPAPGAYAGASLLATADAVAPGGITALRFELRRNNLPIAHGNAAAAPTWGDAANWAGGVDLTGLTSTADGPAQLVAIATIADGSTAESPAVEVIIDRTPPTLSMSTDGRAAIHPGGAAVQIQATLSDTGAGFAPGAQAKLAFTGATHAAVMGPISAGIATFSVALDDVLAPPGINSTVPFSVTALDAVGNSASLAGDPKEVIRVDRAAPIGTVAALTAWHSQVDHVAVSGTLSDPGGSLSGGQAGVVLTRQGSIVGTATISLNGGSVTAGTWSANLELSAQTFADGFQGAWAFSARFTDAAGNTSSADSTILVDNGPPQIASVAVLTAPAGGDTYGPGGNLSITAQITDPSGVAGSQLSFQGQASVSGTTQDGGAWTFSVPRPAGNFDGTLVPFAISASDPFADAGLPQAAAAVHGARAQQSGLLFDNTPPDVSLSSSSTWYVRALPDGGAAVLRIDATVSDGSGPVSPTLTPAGGSPLSPSSNSGDVYSFLLDPAQGIAANDAGPLAFTVTAQDPAGNLASADGTRNIDGAAPALSGLQIFRAADGPPASGTVRYPAAITNTGHDNNHFIYSDTVTIAGTVAERGAGLSSVTLQINGTLPDGGVSLGQPIDLSCGAGTHGCNINYSLALNAPGNGAFSTPIVDGGLPAGALSIAITASDLAKLPDGGPSGQSAVAATPVNVTRYLWREALTRLANNATGVPGIAGLSLHPDGDLIVAGIADGSHANENTIFALPTSGPFADGGVNFDWVWGGKGAPGSAAVGDCGDAPSIGSGDAGTALIYVASSGGYLTALRPDGGALWQVHAANSMFQAAPTVVQTSVTLNNTSVDVEEVVAPADDNGNINGANALYGVYLAPGATQATVNTAPLTDSAATSPALSFNGTLYLGTNAGVFSGYKLSSGDFADAGSAGADGGGFWEPITDGNAVIVTQASSDATPTTVYRLNSLSPINATPLATFNGVIANPALDASGNLYVSTGDDLFAQLNLGSLATQTLRELPSAGQTPVAGSDGHVYLPFLDGYLVAFAGGQPSWSFSRNSAISPSALLDCQGTLYVGSGSSVYAFVTDDHGLANSGWPTQRRDGRASGNADGPKYGIRTQSGCAQ